MLENWHVGFPGCEPVAHLFRTAIPDRWVRFHSLPDSKRYPGDEAEYATVLDRHNTVLGYLAGHGGPVVLLTTGYSNSPAPVRSQPVLVAIDPGAVPWRSVPMHEADPGFAEPTYWHVFASRWDWRPGLFDPLVRLVADGVAANVMLVGPACRWLLHPYDGGMDVISESPASRGRLRSRYAGWMSPYTGGL